MFNFLKKILSKKQINHNRLLVYMCNELKYFYYKELAINQDKIEYENDYDYYSDIITKHWYKLNKKEKKFLNTRQDPISYESAKKFYDLYKFNSLKIK